MEDKAIDKFFCCQCRSTTNHKRQPVLTHTAYVCLRCGCDGIKPERKQDRSKQ